MKPQFTEKDFALRGDSPEEVIDLYINSYLEKSVPGLRNSLTKAFKKAEKNRKPEAIPGGSVYFDKSLGYFYLVQKDLYDPAALTTILFDLLTDPVDPGQGEVQAKSRKERIDRTLKLITKYEELDLEKENQNLQLLAGSLCETLGLVNEEEMSDPELEKLSDQIDEQYFGPIAEILSEILVKIEQKGLGLRVDQGD